MHNYIYIYIYIHIDYIHVYVVYIYIYIYIYIYTHVSLSIIIRGSLRSGPEEQVLHEEGLRAGELLLLFVVWYCFACVHCFIGSSVCLL